jgi:hypothetical protein
VTKVREWHAQDVRLDWFVGAFAVDARNYARVKVHALHRPPNAGVNPALLGMRAGDRGGRVQKGAEVSSLTAIRTISIVSDYATTRVRGQGNVLFLF